jgi:putative transposase
MTQPKLYMRHRFPPEIIQTAVWLYHRFNLSFRDVENLLAEQGVRGHSPLVQKIRIDICPKI